MSDQNGYHANIQDSRILQLMGECMTWEVGRYVQAVNDGDHKGIELALQHLRGFAKTAEVEAKSMTEGTRKEESVQPLQGVQFNGGE